MHLSDTSSIAQHLSLGEIFPKTQQYQNNKITSKDNRSSKRSIKERYNLNSIELISNPVLM